MKIGDHVVMVDISQNPKTKITYNGYPGIIFPKMDIVYTIRDIFPDDDMPALVLEEIVNPIPPGWTREFCFSQFRFRVVELPPNLENEIQEALNKPLKKDNYVLSITQRIYRVLTSRSEF